MHGEQAGWLMFGCRRPVQGMGLARHESAVKREPLGPLEIGERGEVKRVRR
jgi:hypothetical protein